MEWWVDPFVQRLADEALDRHAWEGSDEREGARHLIEHAVFAADSYERHNVSRHGAWMVLSRVFAIDGKGGTFGDLLSLACGYPSLGGEGVDYEVQHRVLHEIADRVEDMWFRPAFEEFKAKANEREATALDSLLHHLQSKCNVPNALGRAAPFYYGPFIDRELGEPPDWWRVLTIEVWQKLLGEDAPPPRKAILLECLEVITPQVKGMVPVVEGPVRLRVTLPEGASPDTVVKVVRQSSGTKNQKEWVLQGQASVEIIDSDPPSHRAPIRYVAAGDDLKPGSVKVVSMRSWEPGVFICSRTASKVSTPKHAKKNKDKIDLETSLTLNGEGRHYIDVYVSPGVNVGESASYSADDDLAGALEKAIVSRVSDDDVYGFEADTRGDCFYQLDLAYPEVDGEKAEKTLRIYIACTEVSPEECGSEFERLIRLNRQRDGGRATTDVSVDRKLRCTDLQSWMLDESQIKYSYYPLVLGPDYSHQWRSRNWNSEDDTIISQGRFPNDPRPQRHEMEPPANFIECRLAIAKRIRGDDGNGLLESAKLGEWIVAEKEFAELIERYVRSYLDWLDADRTSAAWCDLSIVTGFEADGTTLVQEPDAILVSPLHPIRMAWHAVAQSTLFLAQKRLPCPAASVLDPDCILDAIALPMRSPSGGLKEQVFFSVECSSDYWAILWNASRLGQIPNWAGRPPFDREFGIQVGGISSGFSVSQVHRALDEISEMLVAKPILNILVSSAAGQNNSCNEGLLSWCKENFSQVEDVHPSFKSLGHRLIQILDERKADARPEDAEVSNLADDTQNAVRWFDRGVAGITPDLGIVAQLETTGATHDETKIGSALGFGGLIRHRVRQQLKGGSGAFLRESRMGIACPPSGDGLADNTVAAIVRLENLSDAKHGYTFAPSVPSIQALLDRADFVAVSSAAVDPACFLGGWLERAYLWDYQLPSYSGRAGDSNGYYLLSKIKEVDQETLATVLSRLPNCADLPESLKEEVILEVARRGIPTVRGLSSGDSGASGDLGLFVAARLLQNEFSTGASTVSLFPIVTEENGVTQIVLVIPVDPFRGYLDDLARAIKRPSNQRPDLLIASVSISESRIDCKITPIEVKFRGAKDPMSLQACQDALLQAQSLSSLLEALKEKANDQDLALWRLALQHLLTSILVFGFRVYSQQGVILRQAERWATYHARLVEAIYSGSFSPEIDASGRLIVIDGSAVSGVRDVDGDGFNETMVLSHKDASLIVKGEAEAIYTAIKSRVFDWKILSGQQKRRSTPEMVTTDEGKRMNEIPVAGESTRDVIVRMPPEGRLHSFAVVSSSEKEPEAIETPDEATIKDEGAMGVNLLIGKTVDGFDIQMRHLNLSDTNLNQLNIGVVGDLGTGKTQLLKSIVSQITKSAQFNQGVKPRVLIFDYKKDYSSPEFVAAVGAKVVKPIHLPINLFDLAGAGNSTAPWLDRFKFFADVLDKIFPGVGPVQRAKLKNAVRKSYDDCQVEGRQPTIYDVHANYRSILGNGADAPMAIIDDLVDMEMFSLTPTDAAGFDDFLDGVVVVSLDSLGQDDRTKNMLVAIMLNMFYEHMLRIPKRPYYGENKDRRVVDSFLLVDEADNIMRYEFDVLRKILLQGREFGVGVILASQYLKHFKSGATDYREPLLSWFIHKVPNITPQELSALGLVGDSVNLVERVKSLALHECLFKTFNVSGEIVKGVPFYRLSEYGR